MLTLLLRFSFVVFIPSCLSLRRQAAGVENLDVAGVRDVNFGPLEEKQAECDALLEKNKDGFLKLPDAVKAQGLLSELKDEWKVQNDEFQQSIYPVDSRVEVNYQGKWYPGKVVSYDDGIFKVHADGDPAGTLTTANLGMLKGGSIGIDASTVNELMNHQDKIDLAKDVFKKAINMQESVEFSLSAGGTNVSSNFIDLKDKIPGYSGAGHFKYNILEKLKTTRFGDKAYKYSYTIYTDKCQMDHGRCVCNGAERCEFNVVGFYADKETKSMTSTPEFQSGGMTFHNMKIRMTSRGKWFDSEFLLEWDLAENAESCSLEMDIEAQKVACRQ